MEGDILIIEEHHRKAAARIVDMIWKEINDSDDKYIITVGGESGSGKSETAASIADELKGRGLPSYVFQQDDYFVHPPQSNAEVRKQDISWVGPQEVKLDLLDTHLSEIKKGNYEIKKPLVIFKENRITEETVNLGKFRVFIAEGTYTTLLMNADKHVFIDRDLKDTLESRRKRNREQQDEFLEQILTIEHNIISAHKEFAEIIITREFDVALNK